jgi:hypothetical protein
MRNFTRIICACVEFSERSEEVSWGNARVYSNRFSEHGSPRPEILALRVPHSTSIAREILTWELMHAPSRCLLQRSERSPG